MSNDQDSLFTAEFHTNLRILSQAVYHQQHSVALVNPSAELISDSASEYFKSQNILERIEQYAAVGFMLLAEDEANASTIIEE